MRLIVDATAVREHGGGLSTYAVGLVGAWSRRFPTDHLVVAAGDPGGERILRAVAGDVRAAPVWGGRFAAQHALIPLLTRGLAPDAVLALVPAAPLLPVGVPVIGVVHDVRSWLRPEEFSPSVRIYRRIAYHHAFHRSARLIAVSERTRSDLATICRRSAGRTHVVHPAADHVDEWPSTERGHHVVTFGHWTNKRPRLAIEAWATALGSTHHDGDWRLHVVGVPEEERQALVRAARERGVESSVTVHGYLPATDYRPLFSSASAVLMLSTFEGFGLPVVEAMRRGVHVIATRDPALIEAGGGSAKYVGDQRGLVRALGDVLEQRPIVDRLIASGLERTQPMTWAAVAAAARDVVQEAIAGDRAEA